MKETDRKTDRGEPWEDTHRNRQERSGKDGGGQFQYGGGG